MNSASVARLSAERCLHAPSSSLPVRIAAARCSSSICSYERSRRDHRHISFTITQHPLRYRACAGECRQSLLRTCRRRVNRPWFSHRLLSGGAMRAMPEKDPAEVRDRADRIALGRLKNKLNPAQPRLDFFGAREAFLPRYRDFAPGAMGVITTYPVGSSRV